MAWGKNPPISRKFIYDFGIVCGLCIALGSYTFVTFRGISAKNLAEDDDNHRRDQPHAGKRQPVFKAGLRPAQI